MLLEKAKTIVKALGALDVREATKSMRTVELLIVALWSLGLPGASGGSAEEKFHSSSSLETVGAGGGGGWLDPGLDTPRRAKGSLADGGGAKADCDGVCDCGRGVMDWGPGAEPKEANCDIDGVGLDVWAVLFSVKDDNKAGPGISGLWSQYLSFVHLDRRGGSYLNWHRSQVRYLHLDQSYSSRRRYPSLGGHSPS